MNRSPRLLLLSTSLLLGLALGGCRPEERTPTVETAPCVLASPGAGGDSSARCGTLEVPSGGDGEGTLEVAFAVVPARGRARPIPILVLAGGPGQSAIEQYPGAAQALKLTRDRQDLVLVDQRGTGDSAAFGCAVPEETELVESIERSGSGSGSGSGSDALAKEQAWLKGCVEGAEHPPSAFTTEAFIGDLERVREALDYPAWHLYAVSYGTRVALTYMARHPDRIATAVLDGVVPSQLAVGADMDETASAALGRLLDRCAADEACGARFGDSRARLAKLLDDARREPREVRFAHPRTGDQLTRTVDEQMLARSIFYSLYAPETARLIPLNLKRAEEGDPSALLTTAALAGADVASGIDQALHLSVLCAEDAPFFDRARSDEGEAEAEAGGAAAAAAEAEDRAAAAGSPEASADVPLLPLEQSAEYRRLCSAWPAAKVSPDFKQAVQSTVPTLLLSGADDPVTPPAFAELAAQTLPNSASVVVRGGGHNVGPRGCIPRLIAELYAEETVEGLELECVDALAPLPFFLSPLGHVAEAP